MLRCIGISLYLCFSLWTYSEVFAQEGCENRITGVTLVAPPRPFEKNPMMDIENINAHWIAVVPYGFTPASQSRVYFDGKQWWGETSEGVEKTIVLAKEHGLRIMLKPQLWMHGGWVGDLEYHTEAEWRLWEKDYLKYILRFAKMAEKYSVDILCIGTEFKKAVVMREKFWRSLIEAVREEYSGMITYSANWDEFETMPLWDDLDIIGISAYFPLSDKNLPDVKELQEAWTPVKERISEVSRRFNKKVLFTEYGYLSVDGCAGKTWILENKREELNENQRAQANAIEALFISFEGEEYWLGCFYWKWYSFQSKRLKDRDKDYTPQGKLAEKTISKWYSKINAY